MVAQAWDPALERLRHDGSREYEANPGYTASSEVVWANSIRPCLKEKIKNQKRNTPSFPPGVLSMEREMTQTKVTALYI